MQKAFIAIAIVTSVSLTHVVKASATGGASRWEHSHAIPYYVRIVDWDWYHLFDAALRALHGIFSVCHDGRNEFEASLKKE